MVWFYRVVRPSEYLAITGIGIRDIRLAKKAWNLPGQSCRVIDISPVKYTFNVKAMSAEKLPFILHAVFTIGPRTEDKYSLSKYARLIFQLDKQSTYLKDLIHSSIECHVRALSASMTMEEIFCSAKLKNELCEKVELELDRSGLTIYNAIVQQLEDVVSQEYFSFLRSIMTKQKEFDAVLYQQKRQAETELYIQQQKADGELYVKKREAEGLDSLTQSQGCYLRMLKDSFGWWEYNKLSDYLMASWKVCPNIAKTSADTFKGLLEGTS